MNKQSIRGPKMVASISFGVIFIICSLATITLAQQQQSAAASDSILNQVKQQKQQQQVIKGPLEVDNATPIHRDNGKIFSSNVPNDAAAAVANNFQAQQQEAAAAAAAAAAGIAPRPTRHLHSNNNDGHIIINIMQAKKIVDLSYVLDDNTLHWPKNSGFQYKSLQDGEKRSHLNEAYYLRSDGFTMATHTGTHLDAPRHFSKEGWTVEKIPLERLIDIPLTVLDLSSKVKANRSYSFSKEDLLDPTSKEPVIQAKSVVLIYTGISEFYSSGEKAYFGTDTKNISEMKIPGFSREAAHYLVERQVYGVGLDAPSADSSDRHGPNEQYDPQAHSILNSNNIYILENVNNKLKELLDLPAARLTIAPLPIVGGSGSPVRLIAIAGHDEAAAGAACHCPSGNSASNQIMGFSKLSITTLSLSIALFIVYINRRYVITRT